MKKFLTICFCCVVCICCFTGCRPPHRYAEEWSYDGTYHWHAVTCIHDVEPAKEAHTMENGECTVCGYGRKNADTSPETPVKPPVQHITSVGPVSLKSQNGNSTITVYDGDGDGSYYRNGVDTLRRKEYCVMPLGTLDLSYLKEQRANVMITMTFTMWEVDDGYQEIYFYNKGVTSSDIKDESNTNNLLNRGILLAYKSDIEHGPGKKLTAKTNYRAECVVRADKITGNEIWILFDANGNEDDTWCIQNISVTVAQTSYSTYGLSVKSI